MKKIHLTDSRPVFQGDLRIKRVDAVPADAMADTSFEARIVAHSETGHHHVLDGDVSVFRRAGDSMTAYVESRSEVQLKHLRDWDTHETLEFTGGSPSEPVRFECRRQREHTPEGWRRVED